MADQTKELGKAVLEQKASTGAGIAAVVGGLGLALWLWIKNLKPGEAIYAIFGEMEIPLAPGPQVVYEIFGYMEIPLAPGPQTVYAIYGYMEIPLVPPPPSVVYAIFGEMEIPLAPSEYIEGYILSTGISPATAPAAILVSPVKEYYDWGEEVVVMCTWGGFWDFLYWEVDGIYNSSPANGLFLTMYGNRSVVANLQYSPAGTYTVSVVAGDIQVSTDPVAGQYIVQAGGQVSLSAWTPDPELTRAYWEVNGVIYNEADITLTVNSDITAIARLEYIYV